MLVTKMLQEQLLKLNYNFSAFLNASSTIFQRNNSVDFTPIYLLSALCLFFDISGHQRFCGKKVDCQVSFPGHQIRTI